MEIRTKKIIRICIGISLVLIGLFGLFLPFLQGILFIIAGLYLIELGPIQKFIRKIKEKWKKKRRLKERKKEKKRERR